MAWIGFAVMIVGALIVFKTPDESKHLKAEHDKAIEFQTQINRIQSQIDGLKLTASNHTDELAHVQTALSNDGLKFKIEQIEKKQEYFDVKLKHLHESPKHIVVSTDKMKPLHVLTKNVKSYKNKSQFKKIQKQLEGL